MTRRVWAKLVVCALVVGCGGPQYYPAPPEKLPQPTDVGGVAVQIIDQRPEWEKKPFTGVVCLYHLGKAHPDAWAQLSAETNAIVEQLPQKPERVEIDVSSFRLVRSPDSLPKYRDLSAGPTANPQMRTQQITRTNAEERERTLAANGVVREGAAPQTRPVTEGEPTNKVEMALAPKDDPRRLLQDHPPGASCWIQGTIRLTYTGGQVQTVEFKTIARAPNDSDNGYWGQALDNATRSAVADYGRQFRTGVGVKVN